MAQSYSLNPEPVRWSVLAPILAIALLLIPLPAWIIDEIYSRDMYPWLQGVFTATTNVLPFAVIDVLLIVGGLAALYRARRLVNVARQRGVMDALWEAFRRVVRAAAILTILFFWSWGFNYRRIGLDQIVTERPPARVSVEMLQGLVVDANSLATQARRRASSTVSYDDAARELGGPLDAALKRLRRLPLEVEGRPKYSVVLTPFFTLSGVTGMINPLGLEAIVHPDLLPFERPFVLAHEWAHLSGHADEAEASALAFLACLSGSPTLAYSAALFVIGEATGALPPPARQTAWARLDAGVRGDLEAIRARMQDQDPRVQRSATRVYDTYLKANRVGDGAASYGRALALILTPPFRDALANYSVAR
jgi:hypothetical protein